MVPPVAASLTPELLRSTELLDDYSDRELESICDELRRERFSAGEIILHEGEVGDRLHLILQGSARVYTHDERGDEIVLARLERGAYFGEQALLTATPLRRNASVCALTELETASLTHTAFQKHLKADQRLRALLAEVGQRQLILKITHQLRDQGAQQREIGRLLERIRELAEREVLFRQGDVPDHAYFLLGGCVEIRFFGEDRRLRSRTSILPGQFFGELGALDKTSRAGTAVATVESQVAVIDADTFAAFHRENARLRTVIASLKSLYQVPALGLVTQYQGDFLGRPAIHTTIRKPSGEVLTVSRLTHANVFSIAYPDAARLERHEHLRDRDDHARELILEGRGIAGVISLGAWDDLPEVFNAVYHQAEVSESALEAFHQNGRLDLQVDSPAPAGFLCECLRVPREVIERLVAQGVTSVEDISAKTGAGTVCGGCRPRILELTGGSAWTAVAIVHIREHNPNIRSYRLRPLEGRVFPYRAGQHIVIEGKVDGRWIARPYTLTDVDETNGFYEITVKREPRGYFSNWLFSHDRERIEIRVSKPQGGFVFEPDLAAPACCLMAGIGITPAIAFGRHLLARGKARTLHIDYSVRAEEEAAFQRELADWPQQGSNISIHRRITSRQGHLGEADLRALLDRHSDADIYVCGPDRYAVAITASLTQLGVPPGKVHLEEFIQAGAPRSAGRN
jgi:ferredoxin-NADP reductase/CRP-like cAMP-binding protein/bacterioferritin-associated ferredoxin